MTASALPAASRAAAWRQVLAFVRRDLLDLLSYRAAMVTELVGLLAQVAIFSFVAEMIDPASLPTYGGSAPTYLEFVTVGITVGAFMQLGIASISGALRREQLIGTLESVLAAPVSPGVLQVGCLAFNLIYTPIRILAFLLLSMAVFGLDLALGSLLPALAVSLAFFLVVAGMGIAAGAAILTFRRGGNIMAAAVMGLGAISGAYFPIELLPDWMRSAVAVNPVAIALEGTRLALLGGAGWRAVMPTVVALSAMAVPALVVGSLAFRAALRREVARGGLGLY